MDTRIDSEDISILQISDSFFPTGLYATSSGLEVLSQLKKLKDKDVTEFIATYLKQVMGPSDCTALGNAYQSCKRRDMTSLL
ncbi:MAG TPA: urease accessory protein, partial [Nitrososphaeraceae archaeon]|nr:urease accessory protein [Nitrososphaeraceae archaeon]